MVYPLKFSSQKEADDHYAAVRVLNGQQQLDKICTYNDLAATMTVLKKEKEQMREERNTKKKLEEEKATRKAEKEREAVS
jgi:hypothetical protein